MNPEDYEVEVTLTAKDLEFYDTAEKAGVPRIVVSMYREALQRLVAAEREACAKVAEERLLNKANCTAEQMYEMQKKNIAEAIRARGQG